MTHPDADVPDPGLPLFPTKRSGEAGAPLPVVCPDCGQAMTRVNGPGDEERHRCDNPECPRNRLDTPPPPG